MSDMSGMSDERRAREMRPLRVVFIVTLPNALRFLVPYVPYFLEDGWEVHLISSPEPDGSAIEKIEGATLHQVPINRLLSPVNDLYTVAVLTDLLLDLAPDAVVSSTPKAGLLGTMASRGALIPFTVYHLRGFIPESAEGWKKRLLLKTEEVACRLANVVVAEAPSLKHEVVRSRVVDESKIVVLHNGSNGIKTEDFQPLEWKSEGNRVREELGIGADDVVVGFVGRMVQQKGVEELVKAWVHLAAIYPQLHLLLVGYYEEHDPISMQIQRVIRTHDRIHEVGRQKVVQRYYAAMDLFCLPSYREGYPVVGLEAACMGLPIVTTLATGCMDAVLPEKTGLQVPVADVTQLGFALNRYIESRELREKHGAAGRHRVQLDYRLKDLAREWIQLLRQGTMVR